MARLIFLAGNDVMLLQDLPYPPETLLNMLDHGQAPLPEPYRTWIKEDPRRLMRVDLGGVVVARVLEAGDAAPQNNPENLARLSLRDIELLKLLAEGLSMKEISARTGSSPHTISRLVGSLKSRLGMRTIAQTVGRATALGLVKMKKSKKT